MLALYSCVCSNNFVHYTFLKRIGNFSRPGQFVVIRATSENYHIKKSLLILLKYELYKNFTSKFSRSTVCNIATKFKENWFSSLRDIYLFLKIANFFFLHYLKNKLILLYLKTRRCKYNTTYNHYL